ncbi:MAG: cyclopropane-fatty-acyl-phospholipid synthase family protein [Alphaproteobacteria bacterium]
MLLAHLMSDLIKVGQLTMIDATGKTHVFGPPDGSPAATIRIHDKAMHRKLFMRPQLYFGEGYMDGGWTLEQGTLHDVLTIMCANLERFERHPLQRTLDSLGRLLRRVWQYNPIGKAQRNVAHHYDLNDTLYDLFLDRDRQYSCAYFADPGDSLETAQHNKKAHIAAKMLLEPGQKVLDIGSGWGGLALFLAQAAGCDVTGLTLSTEQHKVATDRARAAGLEDRVRFHLRDYREQTGQFDRIVSVGMFEHVGVGHYMEYFGKVKDLLADDGVCLLHSIGRMEPPGSTNSWLRKYIFPGGYTPALSETLSAIESVGLWVTDIEILRLHYAETLRHWHDRFQANRERIAQLYDERFCRMWEFYLVGCEMSFRFMGQMVFQMQIAKRQDAVPLTRDYMLTAEQALRGDKPKRRKAA